MSNHVAELCKMSEGCSEIGSLGCTITLQNYEQRPRGDTVLRNNVSEFGTSSRARGVAAASCQHAPKGASYECMASSDGGAKAERSHNKISSGILRSPVTTIISKNWAL